jgi:hypothetical protein
MKGVGRNPKGDGNKKGGLKVHLLTDVHAGSAKFATISEAKMHDRKFLSKLSLDRGSMVTMERAYNYCRQFAEWTREGVFFVTRQKENAKSEVIETLYECSPEDSEAGKKGLCAKRRAIQRRKGTQTALPAPGNLQRRKRTNLPFHHE